MVFNTLLEMHTDNHSTDDSGMTELGADSSTSGPESQALYEATGFTRLHDAYGISDQHGGHLEHISHLLHGDTSSTASGTTTSDSDHSSSRSSESGTSSDFSDKQLLINLDAWCGRPDERERQVTGLQKETNEMNDEDSEDEITRKPISAREVIEHNKQFGRRTADYWWVHGEKVYSDYFVALLRPMTPQEMTEASQEDIMELKKDLANAASLSDILEEFDKVLSRFEVKLIRQPSIPSGDPNLLAFPTPHDFVPSDLRNWIVNWEPFDFQVEPSPCIEPIDLGDPADNVEHKLRPWLDDWQPFDTEIKGKSAWKCLDLEAVISKDIPTKKQIKLIEARAKRNFGFNPKKIEIRRQRLLQYFKVKYNKTDAELEKYSMFLPNLEENSRQLLCLCSCDI